MSQLVSRTESHSLCELNRQITPPTKNGHAPPSTKLRKSSQSANLLMSGPGDISSVESNKAASSMPGGAVLSISWISPLLIVLDLEIFSKNPDFIVQIFAINGGLF
jgi:hypothetical protein